VRSLHSAWSATDPFLRTVVESWRIMARGLGQRDRHGDRRDFPLVLHARALRRRPEYIESLADFVRGRPMPPVDAFMRQSGAVLTHDASAALGSITAPTLITFGEHDMVTSPRFAAPLSEGINGAEVVVFSGCAHAPIYEITEEFNQRTLEFLRAHSG
jgi:pimeloyl-ACP methyl ester carboxylesterase